MGKKKQKEKQVYARHPESLRLAAVERMKLGCNVSQLAEELGVGRTSLYDWRWKAEEQATAGTTPAMLAADFDPRDHKLKELESKVAHLESELGRRSLEISFFKGALRRIEESRQSRSNSGGTASTPKSGAGCKRKAD